ncbi:MAG: CRTAC1 family protein [Aureliella sp.]
MSSMSPVKAFDQAADFCSYCRQTVEFGGMAIAATLENRFSRQLGVLCAGLLLLSACTRSAPPPATEQVLRQQAGAALAADEEASAASMPIVLSDVSTEAGIDFDQFYNGQGGRYIIEEVTGGMASFDYDMDGLIDVYFTNGATLPVQDANDPGNQLFRNLGNWRFQRVSQASQTDDRSFSIGVVSADFDNDGFEDLFVNNFGANRLYRNNGDGTFCDVTQTAEVAGGEQLGAGACFVDVDRDGLLDLYVGNYVKQPIARNKSRTTDGFPSYPGPLDFEPETDLLYRNEGNGHFQDISLQSGIADVATTSMGTIATDIDNDGDSDIVVVNDVERNLLFENDGQGHFAEVGILRGLAFSRDARSNGNMGIDCADLDDDGWMDLFTTTFSNDSPVLYHNDKSGNFEDVTHAFGAGVAVFPHANWGTAFFDVENDGDRDIFIANGHTDPNVQYWAYTTSWKVANTLLVNSGKGRFEDKSQAAGTGLLPIECSRGLSADDFDNDGLVDLIVLNALSRPTVIRNESRSGARWLQIELIGRTACRDASGARVTVEYGPKRSVAEIHSGAGYQSGFGKRLTFGLGDCPEVSRLTVLWPDGMEQTIERVATNQLLKIVQPAAAK